MLTHFKHVLLSEILWTVAFKAPLSMEFSGQDYRSDLPRPPPGDLPDPGIKSTSLMSPALVGRFIYNELRYFLLPEYRIPNTSDSKFGTKAYKEFRDFTSSTHNPQKPHTQILEHRSSKSSEISHFKHRPWTLQTPTWEHKLYSVLQSYNLKKHFQIPETQYLKLSS